MGGEAVDGEKVDVEELTEVSGATVGSCRCSREGFDDGVDHGCRVKGDRWG